MICLSGLRDLVVNYFVFARTYHFSPSSSLCEYFFVFVFAFFAFFRGYSVFAIGYWLFAKRLGSTPVAPSARVEERSQAFQYRGANTFPIPRSNRLGNRWQSAI